MVEWLVLYVAITDFSDSANVEMLIPLLFGKQIKSRVWPPALEYRQPAVEDRRPASEPFSAIPSEAFVLDEQPVFASQKSRSIKKDLSRDTASDLPISIYIHEHDGEDAERATENEPNDLSRVVAAQNMPVLFLHQHSGSEDGARETENKPEDLNRGVSDDMPVLLIHQRSDSEERARETEHKMKDLSRDVSDKMPVLLIHQYSNEGRARNIKDLSRDMADNMVSIYLHEHISDREERAREKNTNEAVTAPDLTSEVMLYLCGELRDTFENPLGDAGDCRECCPHVHALLQDGRARGLAASPPAQGKGNDSEGKGSLSLFGPVGGRRDWMVINEKFPGMVKHYINTGK